MPYFGVITVCVRIRAFFHRPQNRMDRHGLAGKRIDNKDIQQNTQLAITTKIVLASLSGQSLA